MNPNVTYHSYGPPGNETESHSRQQQQQSVVAADATHGRRQDTMAMMRNSYLSYASTTNTPSWVNPSTMLETQAQSTPVMRGSRPLPDPSLYHGRNGSQQQQGYGVSMYSGVYGSVRGGRPVSGGYVITNVTEEEEEEEYEERGGGGGEAMGHDSDNVGMSRVGGQYRGYQGGTLGYSMPVGMGMGVPMERVATRGTRPLPIPGASQPLGDGSSGKKKSTFVGGFWVGLRRLPKRVLRYGSRKAKELPEVEHEEDDQQGAQDDQQGAQDRQEDQEDQEDQNDQGDQQDSQEDQEDQEDQENQNDQNDQDDQQEQEQQKSQQSPETAHPAPATDYIKMATSYSSFTDDPSFTTELNPLLRCLHALSHLPWISNRSTVDYRPLAGFGGQPGGRGVLKSNNNSWYRRPGDDPSGGGGITGHSLDLLAAEGEGDGASVSAWRRRVAKRQQQQHHHHHHCHCHRRHRHEHRRYQRRRRRRRRSTSTITFEEHRQPMPFPYLPAFPGPSEGSTPGRVVYMPMMCH